MDDLDPVQRAELEGWAANPLDPRTAAQLRHAINMLESVQCTGITASWCPVHGDCTCSRSEHLDDPNCMLHAALSSHGSA